MPAPAFPAFFPASGPAFTAEAAQGGFVPDYLFGERRPDALTIRQRICQLRQSYTRPTSNALNCSAYATARFCDDTAFRDLGMGLTEWTRVWATVPAQIIDYETFAYTFPGYGWTLASYGRVPISLQITSKLILDFFLVGAGGTYADAGSIPVIYGQTYAYGQYSGDVPAEYLTLTTSTPTLTAYQALVATDLATPSSYSLEAHDSILEPFLGNIWRRTRRRVKAR